MSSIAVISFSASTVKLAAKKSKSTVFSSFEELLKKEK